MVQNCPKKFADIIYGWSSPGCFCILALKRFLNFYVVIVEKQIVDALRKGSSTYDVCTEWGRGLAKGMLHGQGERG